MSIPKLVLIYLFYYRFYFVLHHRAELFGVSLNSKLMRKYSKSPLFILSIYLFIPTRLNEYTRCKSNIKYIAITGHFSGL